MFLGGCPCCGEKGPCWKCYGKQIDCSGLLDYWQEILPYYGASPEDYRQAFRISGSVLDTDSQPPSNSGADGLEWDMNFEIGANYQPSDSVNFDLLISIGTNRTADSGFNISIKSCVEESGVKFYDLLFTAYAPAIQSEPMAKHVDIDGNETTIVLEEVPFAFPETKKYESKLRIPVDQSSPFFLGSYFSEFWNGHIYEIEFREAYQLLNNLSEPVERQCFAAPPLSLIHI